MMSEPVVIENSNYTNVKNYGTGFAPYFIALGLWVGALMLTFLVKPLNNRLISSGAHPVVAALSGLIPTLIIGLIQAVLLCLVVQFALHIEINHPLAFYGFAILTAFTFASILQLCMAAFGFPGKFIAIIFLMLQLTTAAGTFPIETCPEFFQALSPYMPMTYVVSGLKQVISGVNLSMAIEPAVILLAVGVVCFIITCLVAWHRRTVTMTQLHPLIEL